MLETTIPPEWKQQWDELVKQLQDPFKLRVVTLGVVAIAGFFAAYRPMDTRIQTLRRELKASEDRLEMIAKVDILREQKAKLLELFPEHGTLNFWTEYFLVGVRESGVKLRNLESQPRKHKMGDRQVVYLNLEIDGDYEQLHRLLSWIEDNKWFSRVIRTKFKEKNGHVESKITVAVLAAKDGAGGA